MSSPVNVGDVLAGKYQVEHVLGVGGMGVVVSAKHLVLGERVAIKFLLPQALARQDVVTRFLQEGKAAAKLRSEHTTRVHDVGKLESGAPFLVMEYLDGKDLGAVMRDRGKLPVETAVAYLLQACEALAEAHAIGIVHRDLKPSNLFIIKRLDGSPSVKLIDFGISKIQLPGGDGEQGGEMTGTAVMMGSPFYMAPEQMASARDVDGRADIWSLGIILYEVLAGARPFRGPGVMQVYEQIMTGTPSIRALRAEVPEGVEAAILTCLRKDRTLRFASVGELADAIAPFGPPDARVTADRVKRIIQAHVGSGSMPPPADKVSATVPVAALTPAALSLEGPSTPGEPGVSKPPIEAPSQPSASSAAIDPQATDGAWGQNMRPPAKKRPLPTALIAAAVAVVAVVAPAAFFALRAHDRAAPTPPVDPSGVHAAVTASAPVVPPSAAPPSAEPSVVPVGAPADAPAEVVVASAAARPSAAPFSVPPPDRRRRDPPLPPPAQPQPPHARAKSPDDLFNTQK